MRLITLMSLLSASFPAFAQEEVCEGTTTERTYAMQQVFTSQMREPNPFSTQEWRSTHTRTWSVVKWTQVGTQVTWTETTCGLSTEKVFGAETIYPDSFIRSIDVRYRSGTLSAVDAGSSFKAGPYVQSFGVKLSDPFREALPTDAADPRIADSDHDGQPGVTVTIRHPMMGEGHVFVAQRSVARLEGTYNADNSVSGYILTAPDMFKIGADRWWLNVDSPQRQHPDRSQSTFVMKPASDALTCSDLLRRKGEFFP